MLKSKQPNFVIIVENKDIYLIIVKYQLQLVLYVNKNENNNKYLMICRKIV